MVASGPQPPAAKKAKKSLAPAAVAPQIASGAAASSCGAAAAGDMEIRFVGKPKPGDVQKCEICEASSKDTENVFSIAVLVALYAYKY